MASCAYVTFVMRNDHYVPGALVFAYALKEQGITDDIVCLITPLVSAASLEALQEVFDHVITIDPIIIFHANRHERQERPFLFTRFQAFRLGPDGDLGCGYDKIILCDADILPLKNYASLKEVTAPAGILNEYKDHCVASINGKYHDTRKNTDETSWHWHEIYHAYLHGKPIPSAITNRIRKDTSNLGINACLYVLSPSMAMYQSILSDINNPYLMREIAYYPWPEMQYLTLKLSGQWTNIDLRYASFNGYPSLDILYGTHFAGLKPWNIEHKSVMHYFKFPDYQRFLTTYIQMMHEYPTLLTHKKYRRIYQTFLYYNTHK